jgi:hypothetical protein
VIGAGEAGREWIVHTGPMPPLTLRSDLLAAQAQAWRSVTSAGACFDGVQRWAIAQVALHALDDSDPLPPWAPLSGAGRIVVGSEVLTEPVVNAVYRLARHASSLTEGWYRERIEEGLDPLAYVELVAVVSVVAAVDGFFRASGSARPPLPEPLRGEAHGRHPQVEPATRNWVLVAAPADQHAAVVQGLSAVPDDMRTVRLLAAAQYIPFDAMGDLGWNRGTLSRGEMELCAARLSRARECFY